MYEMTRRPGLASIVRSWLDAIASRMNGRLEDRRWEILRLGKSLDEQLWAVRPPRRAFELVTCASGRLERSSKPDTTRTPCFSNGRSSGGASSRDARSLQRAGTLLRRGARPRQLPPRTSGVRGARETTWHWLPLCCRCRVRDGTFCLFLSRCWGVRVFGVDRSPQMLSVARQNCRDDRVCFLEQDLRCLSLPEPVDLVTANFDVVNHLIGIRDLQQALARIAANLRPEGHFVFDAITNCRPLGGRRVFRRQVRHADRRIVQTIRWDPRAAAAQRGRVPLPPPPSRAARRGPTWNAVMRQRSWEER